MLVKNYPFLIIALCISFSSAWAQKDKDAESANRDAMRKQLKKELEDSIQSSKPREIQFTNNENIRRDKLTISYEVQKILLSKDSVHTAKEKTVGIVLEIPEAEGENVKKAWAKSIKNKTKSKIQSDTYGISILATMIERISPLPINVYSTVNDTEYGVKIIAAYEEDSTFIMEGSHKAKFEGAKKFMRDFGIEQYQVAVKRQVKDHNKVMKGMENDLSKLQRENEKKHKTINDYELNIINSEKDIDENLLDQDRLILAMQDQKKAMGSLKGDPKKEAAKKLKGTEKERKKLQGNHKSLQKKIVKYRAGIEETRREIELNLSQQDLQKGKISDQLSKVKSLEEKLASIK